MKKIKLVGGSWGELAKAINSLIDEVEKLQSKPQKGELDAKEIVVDSDIKPKRTRK